MKITAFLLLISFLTVSAGTFAQKITLKEQHASLEQVLDQIRRQSGYDIVYSNDLLRKSTPVTINIKDATLDEALKGSLQDQPFSYEIEDGTVVIKEKEPSLIEKAKALFAQVTVTGKVQDETGQPLVGVTVKIKNTNQATTTDAKGAYTMIVPDDKTIITFSYIGYETVELVAKDISAGSVIQLKATQTNLKEVVVSKGYYSEKRELLTGNVSTVSAKVIGEQPVSDPILALEGRVPGLQISQTSGIPGASYTVRLRGQNSIANGNNPLYIVDGVPFNPVSLTSSDIPATAVGHGVGNGYDTEGGLSPFNNLSPSDIESVEVLKDADATAIYGSRGANGVILVTTKKGKAGQTKVDVDVNSGAGNVARKIPLLNTQQYLALRHEAFTNDGRLPRSTDYDVNGSWDTTRYTDWQKKLIGNTAHFTNINLSLSGGTTNTQFLLGGAYSRQTTVFPGEYNDQKASGHLTLSHISTNQKFHALFVTQYSENNNLIPLTDFAGLISNIAPDAPAIYDANGNINWQGGTFKNPFARTLQTAKSVSNNLIGGLNLSYELLPDLKVQSNFGYTRMEMNQTNQIPANSYYGPPVESNRENDIATTSNVTWIIEPQISYNKKFGKGKLDLLIGTSIQHNVYNTIGQRATGFSSDALIQNLANAASIVLQGSSYNDYRANSLYGRLNYNWEDKYIVNATARRDGSSRFGPGSQFGNFGAIGAAWIFSKEKWFREASPFLSFGKIRGSYGTTGNDQITNYQYLSSYSNYNGYNYQGTAGLAPDRIANPYFAWEVVKKLEGGLELGFLKDRIIMSVDYYRNRTGNQLVGQPLPSQDGFNSIQANLPAVVQNTGLEVELTTTNIDGNKFKWTSSFNISISRNKLVSYPGLEFSPYANVFEVGKPLFIIPLYHYTGIDPLTGLYTFQDVNNDGRLDIADKQFKKQVAQDYFGGMLNSFSYKGLQLDVFFQFVKQTGLNSLTSFGLPGAFNVNQPTYVLDRWQSPNDAEKTTEKYSQMSGPAFKAWVNLKNSDATVADASFIRLKNVSLSYTLPVFLQRALNLQNGRVYLQGQNLLTITRYQGFDPETKGTHLPPLRMISLGIHASF